MTILKTIKIPEETLQKWDDKFLPPFDLFYLEEEKIPLLGEMLILTKDDHRANPYLYNLDVTTTFTPWNIKTSVKHVAVVPNEQFDQLDEYLKQELLEMQLELGRGNFFEWQELMPILDKLDFSDREQSFECLNKMSISVNGVKWVAFRRNEWENLPWSFRRNFLIMMAESYSEEAVNQKVNVESLDLSPFIRSYVDRFPNENGANCFATALSGITEDRESANWIIQQWIHSQTFLLGLKQRQYEMVNEVSDWKMIDLKAKDIIVWVNKDGLPIHATAAISDVHVFNKDGQTMFNPWLVRNFHELAAYWEDVIQEGGKMHHYRKK